MRIYIVGRASGHAHHGFSHYLGLLRRLLTHSKDPPDRLEDEDTSNQSDLEDEIDSSRRFQSEIKTERPSLIATTRRMTILNMNGSPVTTTTAIAHHSPIMGRQNSLMGLTQQHQPYYKRNYEPSTINHQMATPKRSFLSSLWGRRRTDDDHIIPYYGPSWSSLQNEQEPVAPVKYEQTYDVTQPNYLLQEPVVSEVSSNQPNYYQLGKNKYYYNTHQPVEHKTVYYPVYYWKRPQNYPITPREVSRLPNYNGGDPRNYYGFSPQGNFKKTVQPQRKPNYFPGNQYPITQNYYIPNRQPIGYQSLDSRRQVNNVDMDDGFGNGLSANSDLFGADASLSSNHDDNSGIRAILQDSTMYGTGNSLIANNQNMNINGMAVQPDYLGTYVPGSIPIPRPLPPPGKVTAIMQGSSMMGTGNSLIANNKGTNIAAPFLQFEPGDAEAMGAPDWVDMVRKTAVMENSQMIGQNNALISNNVNTNIKNPGEAVGYAFRRNFLDLEVPEKPFKAVKGIIKTGRTLIDLPGKLLRRGVGHKDDDKNTKDKNFRRFLDEPDIHAIAQNSQLIGENNALISNSKDINIHNVPPVYYRRILIDSDGDTGRRFYDDNNPDITAIAQGSQFVGENNALISNNKNIHIRDAGLPYYHPQPYYHLRPDPYYHLRRDPYYHQRPVSYARGIYSGEPHITAIAQDSQMIGQNNALIANNHNINSRRSPPMRRILEEDKSDDDTTTVTNTEKTTTTVESAARRRVDNQSTHAVTAGAQTPIAQTQVPSLIHPVPTPPTKQKTEMRKHSRKSVDTLISNLLSNTIGSIFRRSGDLEETTGLEHTDLTNEGKGAVVKTHEQRRNVDDDQHITANNINRLEHAGHPYEDEELEENNRKLLRDRNMYIVTQGSPVFGHKNSLVSAKETQTIHAPVYGGPYRYSRTMGDNIYNYYNDQPDVYYKQEVIPVEHSYFISKYGRKPTNFDYLDESETRNDDLRKMRYHPAQYSDQTPYVEETQELQTPYSHQYSHTQHRYDPQIVEPPASITAVVSNSPIAGYNNHLIKQNTEKVIYLPPPKRGRYRKNNVAQSNKERRNIFTKAPFVTDDFKIVSSEYFTKDTTDKGTIQDDSQTRRSIVNAVTEKSKFDTSETSKEAIANRIGLVGDISEETTLLTPTTIVEVLTTRTSPTESQTLINQTTLLGAGNRISRRFDGDEQLGVDPNRKYMNVPPYGYQPPQYQPVTHTVGQAYNSPIYGYNNALINQNQQSSSYVPQYGLFNNGYNRKFINISPYQYNYQASPVQMTAANAHYSPVFGRDNAMINNHRHRQTVGHQFGFWNHVLRRDLPETSMGSGQGRYARVYVLAPIESILDPEDDYCEEEDVDRRTLYDYGVHQSPQVTTTANAYYTPIVGHSNALINQNEQNDRYGTQAGIGNWFLRRGFLFGPTVVGSGREETIANAKFSPIIGRDNHLINQNTATSHDGSTWGIGNWFSRRGLLFGPTIVGSGHTDTTANAVGSPIIGRDNHLINQNTATSHDGSAWGIGNWFSRRGLLFGPTIAGSGHTDTTANAVGSPIIGRDNHLINQHTATSHDGSTWGIGNWLSRRGLFGDDTYNSPTTETKAQALYSPIVGHSNSLINQNKEKSHYGNLWGIGNGLFRRGWFGDSVYSSPSSSTTANAQYSPIIGHSNSLINQNEKNSHSGNLWGIGNGLFRRGWFGDSVYSSPSISTTANAQYSPIIGHSNSLINQNEQNSHSGNLWGLGNSLYRRSWFGDSVYGSPSTSTTANAQYSPIIGHSNSLINQNEQNSHSGNLWGLGNSLYSRSWFGDSVYGSPSTSTTANAQYSPIIGHSNSLINQNEQNSHSGNLWGLGNSLYRRSWFGDSVYGSPSTSTTANAQYSPIIGKSNSLINQNQEKSHHGHLWGFGNLFARRGLFGDDTYSSPVTETKAQAYYSPIIGVNNHLINQDTQQHHDGSSWGLGNMFLRRAAEQDNSLQHGQLRRSLLDFLFGTSVRGSGSTSTIANADHSPIIGRDNSLINQHKQSSHHGNLVGIGNEMFSRRSLADSPFRTKRTEESVSPTPTGITETTTAEEGSAKGLRKFAEATTNIEPNSTPLIEATTKIDRRLFSDNVVNSGSTKTEANAIHSPIIGKDNSLITQNTKKDNYGHSFGIGNMFSRRSPNFVSIGGKYNPHLIASSVNSGRYPSQSTVHMNRDDIQAYSEPVWNYGHTLYRRNPYDEYEGHEGGLNPEWQLEYNKDRRDLFGYGTYNSPTTITTANALNSPILGQDNSLINQNTQSHHDGGLYGIDNWLYRRTLPGDNYVSSPSKTEARAYFSPIKGTGNSLINTNTVSTPGTHYGTGYTDGYGPQPAGWNRDRYPWLSRKFITAPNAVHLPTVGKDNGNQLSRRGLFGPSTINSGSEKTEANAIHSPIIGKDNSLINKNKQHSSYGTLFGVGNHLFRRGLFGPSITNSGSEKTEANAWDSPIIGRDNSLINKHTQHSSYGSSLGLGNLFSRRGNGDSSKTESNVINSPIIRRDSSLINQQSSYEPSSRLEDMIRRSLSRLFGNNQINSGRTETIANAVHSPIYGANNALISQSSQSGHGPFSAGGSEAADPSDDGSLFGGAFEGLGGDGANGNAGFNPLNVLGGDGGQHNPFGGPGNGQNHPVSATGVAGDPNYPLSGLGGSVNPNQGFVDDRIPKPASFGIGGIGDVGASLHELINGYGGDGSGGPSDGGQGGNNGYQAGHPNGNGFGGGSPGGYGYGDEGSGGPSDGGQGGNNGYPAGHPNGNGFGGSIPGGYGNGVSPGGDGSGGSSDGGQGGNSGYPAGHPNGNSFGGGSPGGYGSGGSPANYGGVVPGGSGLTDGYSGPDGNDGFGLGSGQSNGNTIGSGSASSGGYNGGYSGSSGSMGSGSYGGGAHESGSYGGGAYESGSYGGGAHESGSYGGGAYGSGTYGTGAHAGGAYGTGENATPPKITAIAQNSQLIGKDNSLIANNANTNVNAYRRGLNSDEEEKKIRKYGHPLLPEDNYPTVAMQNYNPYAWPSVVEKSIYTPSSYSKAHVSNNPKKSSGGSSYLETQGSQLMRRAADMLSTVSQQAMHQSLKTSGKHAKSYHSDEDYEYNDADDYDDDYDDDDDDDDDYMKENESHEIATQEFDVNNVPSPTTSSDGITAISDNRRYENIETSTASLETSTKSKRMLSDKQHSDDEVALRQLDNLGEVEEENNTDPIKKVDATSTEIKQKQSTTNDEKTNESSLEVNKRTEFIIDSKSNEKRNSNLNKPISDDSSLIEIIDLDAGTSSGKATADIENSDIYNKLVTLLKEKELAS